MKEVLSVDFWALLLVAVLGEVGFGQEIPYDYRVINQAGLQDINKRGDLLATEIDQGNLGVVIGRLSDRFRCHDTFDDTVPRRINNRGDIAGSCLTEAHNKVVGFIRTRKGAFSFIDVPGSDSTIVHALSDQDETCGQYYNPLDPNASAFIRFHGFCHNKQGVIRTIDVPLANSVTVIVGTNRRGKKIGNYFTYNPVTNETGQWHCFEVDNGIFTSLERPGALWSYCTDLTNDDTVLYEDNQDVFILDDGVYYKISDPTPDAGWTLIQVDVNGFNDDLEIVGSFIQRQTCLGIFCPVQVKNFVATPR
jgi:hypothetical protein